MSAFGGKADIGRGSPRGAVGNRRAGADTERGLNPVGGSAQAMFYKRAG